MLNDVERENRIARLRRLYSDRTPLPGHARAMSFQELVKLMRCVTQEVCE